MSGRPEVLGLLACDLLVSLRDLSLGRSKNWLSVIAFVLRRCRLFGSAHWSLVLLLDGSEGFLVLVDLTCAELFTERLLEELVSLAVPVWPRRL